MQDRRRQNYGAGLFLQAMKRGRNEHSGTHEARVAQLEPNFCSSQIRIEDGAEIADAGGEDPARVGVQTDFGKLSKMDIRKIVLVHVTKNPDIGKVRNCEQVW